jgi:predicted nucleotidyltransferase component of viral defense system
MRDELLQILATKEGYNVKLNTMREYLQAFILRILFKEDFFQYVAFLGGTCLRFIFNTRRFSEDLDFSLVQNDSSLNFEKTVGSLERELRNSGYGVRVKTKKNNLYSAMVRLPGLLYDAGMSGRREENLSIKIDLDTHPPKGAQTKAVVINKYFMLGLTHYDLPTLLAGKLNAILTRTYTKGRDLYDLFWYLTTHKDLQPNLPFLKNALQQFNWNSRGKPIEDWKSPVTEHIRNVDWPKIEQEVGLLLEDPSELKLFTKDNLLQLLSV